MVVPPPPTPEKVFLSIVFGLNTWQGLLRLAPSSDKFVRKTYVHCKKKVSDISIPSRDVTYQSTPRTGIMSLVSDIPAGDGPVATFYLRCKVHGVKSETRKVELKRLKGAVQRE